ncbi:28S ribosomal protein S9, mitochondrial [Chrysoperla carnea]|uniref:28S ribosomal protein S9, mitochondrial n=1 Tax=Chrysoperla carnea TaxID=189513 RepID=UPI001D09078B|nr:28S ribosomal protein S9, mitochondrial [Chrysoperla carnea]
MLTSLRLFSLYKTGLKPLACSSDMISSVCNQFMNFNVNGAKYGTVSSDTDKTAVVSTSVPQKKTSKAMKAYLERAKEHDEFMQQQNTEYQIGKRHLANMMGEDPETFTQDDIDNAIEYLFPSGIYDPKARPCMKHPEEIFPQRKAAEFDEIGRPYHFLFFTGKPNYYQLLHDIVNNIQDLNKFEDAANRKGTRPDSTRSVQLAGSTWVSKDELSKILLEPVDDRDYEQFVMAFDRLASHPYAYRINDFIQNYRRTLMAQTSKYAVPKLQYDENGRAFVTTYECLRKTARGHVTMYSPGTGKITINGQDINYFKDLQPREQLLFPLEFTNMTKNVDIEAHVEGGGPSGQAGALRWGIAMCLRNFVDDDMIQKMQIAGLLQRDYRTRERKKPGQMKARRKFTWKKR